MRKYLILAFLFLSVSASAQTPVNTSIFQNLPPAGTITGNELVPLDQNGVTKKATTSQLTLGSMVLGVQSGGTGLFTVGPNGTCLQSTGSSLTYGACGGGGGGTPAGSNGNIQYNNNGSFGPYVIGNGLVVTTSGGMSFLNSTATGGVAPSGSNGAIQYNNSGSFGGYGIGTGLNVSGGNLNATGAPAGASGTLQFNNSGVFGGLGIGTGLSVVSGNLVSTTTSGIIGPAGGDLGGNYPNPTVIGVGNVTTGILPSANGGTGVNALYSVRGIPSNQWTGIRIIGDNNSFYDNAVNLRAASWPQLVANQMGVGPTYDIVNSPSKYNCDIVNSQMATLPPPNSTNNLPNTFLPSLNEASWGGGIPGIGPHIQDMTSCLTGGFAWLTIPDINRIYAQDSTFTTTGSWSNSAAYGGTWGKVTQTNGDTGSGPIVTNGGPIYLWYQMVANNGGTFTWTLDGTTTGSVATQGNNAFSFPISGKTTLGAVPIPVATAGSHTVGITVTSSTSSSNTVTIIGLGTPPGKAYSPKSPLAVFGGQIWTSSANTAEAQYVNGQYQIIAAGLLSNGLGVLFANVQNYFNLSTDVSLFSTSQTVVNAMGEGHIAQAFTGILQPVRSADGSIDPRDYGAACNAQAYISQAGNDGWAMLTTNGSANIQIAKASPLIFHQFQSGLATQSGGGDVGKMLCAYSRTFFANDIIGPCTYISAVNPSTATATIGRTAIADSNYGVGGFIGNVIFGGRPTNPNDPSTAVDDSNFFNQAGQAAILGGGKVHIPTNCMVHGSWPVANVTYEGDNQTLYYGQGSFSSSSTPPVPTALFCSTNGYTDDNPVCADVSQAPFSGFHNFLMTSVQGFPYLTDSMFDGSVGGPGKTVTAIGYSQSSGQFAAGTYIDIHDMSFYNFIVGVGQAFGYNIQTNFTGSIAGNVLNVSAISSTNMNATYNLGSTTTGVGIADYLAIGRVITGAGVPANTTITTAPQGSMLGNYGLSTTSTVSSESMNTVQAPNIMEFKDTHSEYFNVAIGINGDFTDSIIVNSVCTGTNLYYCWYYGPPSGNGNGNGGSRWELGRIEETSKGGLVCDGCLAFLDGVDLDFNKSYSIQMKGTNAVVQQTGGWIVGGGANNTGPDKAMYNLGGSNTKVSVDGVLLAGYDPCCGGSIHNYLFETATGATTSNMNVSVTGGNAIMPGGFFASIEGLFNWTNGTPAKYSQHVAGYPPMDNTNSALSVSATGGMGLGTATPTGGTILDMLTATTSANSSIGLPGGTTANRPATPVTGMLRYNSTIPGVESYYSGAWNTLATPGVSNTPLALTVSGGAVTPNASLSTYYYLTLTTTNVLANNPTSPTDGQKVTFEFRQPSSGGPDNIVWGTSYDFGMCGYPTLSTSNNAYDLVQFTYSGRNSKWNYTGASLGN